MNEGIGSTVVLVIIIVFIALVSAYMAYNVNYTKAFRMKNKIIDLYNEYDGNCNSECQNKILAYKEEIGYSSSAIDDSICRDTNNPFIPNSGDEGKDVRITTFDRFGYCEYRVTADKAYKGPDNNKYDIIKDGNEKPGYYYRIMTRIDIQIPIVHNALGLQVLNVTGDTKTFYEK